MIWCCSCCYSTSVTDLTISFDHLNHLVHLNNFKAMAFLNLELSISHLLSTQNSLYLKHLPHLSLWTLFWLQYTHSSYILLLFLQSRYLWPNLVKLPHPLARTLELNTDLFTKENRPISRKQTFFQENRPLSRKQTIFCHSKWDLVLVFVWFAGTAIQRRSRSTFWHLET